MLPFSFLQENEGEAISAKTDSKPDNSAPETKSETEKPASAAKKDGDNPPPSKAPVSLIYIDSCNRRTELVGVRS